MSNDEPPYAVGYKKPPLHSRFSKGQSGNPQGGRRRAKALSVLLDEALDRPTSSGSGGAPRPHTRREAIVAGLVEKSAAGDLRAIKLLLGLLQKTGAAAPPPAGDEDPRAVLMRQLARLAADGNPDQQP